MQIVSSAIQHALADINGSTNLEGYAVDLTYQFVIGGIPIAGAVSGDDVIALVSADDVGVLAQWFSDIFYHHIWIIEKHTDLGNIVADQEREIELWNAHFTSKTFTGYNVTGDIFVDGMASGTLNALQSTMYSVTIPVAGDPTLIAAIVWTFTDAEDPTFTGTIVGVRVIPFTLRHNWVDPILEQITFKTDVMVPISGKEQRAGIRTEPRRRFEMSYLTLTPLERSYVENVTYGWHGRTYAVPLWSDVTPLTAAVTEGDFVFELDTTTRDYEIGSLMFVTDGTNHDTLEIASFTATTVTTVTASRNSYAVGSRVAPARLGYLEPKFNLSRITSRVESMRFAWMLKAGQVSDTRRTTYTPETYRSADVYNVGNDYSKSLGIEQERRDEMIDAETGTFGKYDIEAFPRRTYPFNNLMNRAEYSEFVDWIYQRRGRLNPFWFCERVPAFFLQEDVLGSDTTMIVTTGGYTNMSFESEARKDIAILTSTGWEYRRITGSVVNVDGVTETITLDSALGVDLIAADNPLMSHLKFVRLAQDSIELSYITTDAVQAATSFTDLLTN